MFLTSVTVNNLFREQLNHKLTFDDSRRITYIIGRNGTGKTTVLKAINAIFNREWQYLLDIQFDSIVLVFDSSISLTISKEERYDLDENQLRVEYSNRDISEEGTIELLDRVDNDKSNQLIQYLVSNEMISELDCGHWSNSSNNHMSRQQVLYEYAHEVASLALPKQILNLINGVHVALLGSERHIAPEEPKSANRNGHASDDYVVESLAVDIVERLRAVQGEVLAELEKISDALEARLMQKGLDDFAEIDQETFTQLYKKYSTHRARLEEVSLSAGAVLEYKKNRVLQDTERALIADIIKQRIKAYEPYLEKIRSLELFNELLTNTLTGKKVQASLPNGIHIETDSGKTFTARYLSSGEQQVVILAYALLFKVPEGSVALIDEPELSMDVDWQSKLSDWLERVGQERDLQFILATHSPLLFMGHISDSVQTFAP